MCGRRRYDYMSLAHDARPGDAEIRVSQGEREETVDLLRRDAGEGRLEIDELEERIEAAYAARTRAELAKLRADLPDPGRRRTGARRTVAAGSLALALLPLAAAVALLSFAPHAISWMAWPLLGWWFFAGLPAAGLGFACSGHRGRRRERSVVV
jgi:hypothetical protein